MQKKRKQTIFVGLSGGVDSAVSAALLQKQDYDVIGVFIRTWHPDFLECNEEEERRDAMRVCAHLNIPFLTFDFEDVYKKKVADYMIAEYRAGRTPNPDVMCNKEVKFGAFLKKALSMGADYVATGHYARVKLGNTFSREYPTLYRHYSKKHSPASLNKENIFQEATGGGVPFRSEARNGVKELREKIFSLQKSPDPLKDQSYFLWTLKQGQLNKILFPIGHLKKTKVRKLAKKFKLPVAEKKDSQGICFLGAVDLKEFLKHYIKEKKGKVINEKREVIGYHDGVAFITLGERHGFAITKKSPNDGRYYVVGKDVKKNILVVSQEKNILSGSPRKILLNFRSRLSPSASVAFHQGCFSLSLNNTNWISKIPEINKNYIAQIRYHGNFLPCQVKIISKTKAKVIFAKITMVAPGQSIVIYEKDICLGGGVVVYGLPHIDGTRTLSK